MAEAPLTALQLLTRILEKSAAPNRPQTIDHVSAGDPTTTVTGIATMAIASLDCLKRAAAAGRNLILTYDPAFWSGNDSFDRLETNGLFLEKRDFIRAHNMVCFNLHDHWRDRMPDGVAEGMAAGLVPIVTRVAAIPDVVTEGIHGRFVPPRDPEAIAQAIVALASDRAALSRMSARCREHARSAYSIERLADDFTALYASLGGAATPRTVS